MIIRLIWIFAVLAVLQGHAQEPNSSIEKASSPLSVAQRDTFHSAILGEKREFNIYLPESFHEASEEHTYPVLVLLEDEFFHMVSGVVKHLSSVERMPETIVVSILDMSYMPTVFTNGSTFWPMEQLSDENPDPFTRHLKEELFPYLEANYRANNFRMVMGLSPTSIYTFHAFVKEPELFDASIAIAAGDMLSMGYKSDERFIDLISNEVKKCPVRDRYLYVTSSDSDGETSPEIRENIEELNKALDACECATFKFIARVFPGEGHYDVALPALIEALGLIFPRDEWSVRYRDIVNRPGNAMRNIDDHYRDLSIKYGFRILPRAERWNSVNRLGWIGPYLLRQGRIAEGVEVIERWSAYRPKSTAALDELAKGYEAANELEKALAAKMRAYDLSIASGSPQAQQYLSELEALRLKINSQK